MLRGFDGMLSVSRLARGGCIIVATSIAQELDTKLLGPGTEGMDSEWLLNECMMDG